MIAVNQRLIVFVISSSSQLQLHQGLVVRPYKQNDGALHCHDVLTLKAVLHKTKF